LLETRRQKTGWRLWIKMLNRAKKAAIYTASLQLSESFSKYLSGLRQKNNLPDYIYRNIPIIVRSFVDSRYDVYVALGDGKFVYYKRNSGVSNEFTRLRDIADGGVSELGDSGEQES
jgi:hypothetical protein